MRIVVAPIFLHPLPQVFFLWIFLQYRGFRRQPALENGPQKLLFAFEMAEKGDFVNHGSTSHLARGGGANPAPVQGFSCSIKKSLARLIGARRDEPFA